VNRAAERSPERVVVPVVGQGWYGRSRVMHGVAKIMMIAVITSFVVRHAGARERPDRRAGTGYPGEPRQGHQDERQNLACSGS
jgi:hypothetical protein